ncbi:actin filament-associated protein 1-like 2 isoform X1 [Pristis pectinata]|uniref:actin filament-associated protein 1-like 2 isoform X1 n=1 Tax=Pristis pectinata TaxID=685728 RepID=UPI00223DEEF6|nr:actin filament-associated protein 1-like 2 isoform X1 [Pristis pectinata]
MDRSKDSTTHLHTRGNLQWSINLPTCTALGCWRKPENSEETHAVTGRTCKLHTYGIRALDQLLTELETFLKLLDNENLSLTALAKKCVLSELLHNIVSSSAGEEEYIYMNKVLLEETTAAEKKASEKGPDRGNIPNGIDLGKITPAPQKSLPELPPAKVIPEREPFPLCRTEPVEGFYEEAEPYDTVNIDEAEAVSSSYESYDEEENTKGKSMTHQWPSPEASIELMKDARICAFLWRKKWLGQWAKQLCVIKECKLLCYKSSKDQNPQLDVSLIGCSIVYKEKQVKKKEHTLKITPVNSDVIVLGLQSKEQADQWLKVIQEISNIQGETFPDGNLVAAEHSRSHGQRLDSSERCSGASESGNSTDGGSVHDVIETKDVKKKSSIGDLKTAGLKLSSFMNLGKKKPISVEIPINNKKNVEASGYLNVFMNSQWRTRWCQVKNGLIYFYQDKSKNKAVQHPLNLEGCEVIPDSTPEHLYSFRILQDGEEIASLEAKSSEEMGYWLGLLLAESGSKTDPEEFAYDYVDADRVSCIVHAAKHSLYLLQRRYSEPNTYIDDLPVVQNQPEDLYDDVDVPESVEDKTNEDQCHGEDQTRVYLDLTPVKSFLHSSNNKVLSSVQLNASNQDNEKGASYLSQVNDKDSASDSDSGVIAKPTESNVKISQVKADFEERASNTGGKPPTSQKVVTPWGDQSKNPTQATSQQAKPVTECVEKQKLGATVSMETKFGKNRTEADLKKYLEEKENLEKEKEQLRNELMLLRKQKREVKDVIAVCKDKQVLCTQEERLRQIEEECKSKENSRVDLELKLVSVKESLKKAELGPVTLGTTVDTSHFDNLSSNAKPATVTNTPDNSPVNSAATLKNRPLSIMQSGKGTVLQKAKEWEKKATS